MCCMVGNVFCCWIPFWYDKCYGWGKDHYCSSCKTKLGTYSGKNKASLRQIKLLIPDFEFGDGKTWDEIQYSKDQALKAKLKLQKIKKPVNYDYDYGIMKKIEAVVDVVGE